MSNQCPRCTQEAMPAMSKVMTRPHVCQHCGAELRMNLIYTGVASLAYFYALIRIILADGLGGGVIYVLLATIIFIVVCLFIPFEEKTKSF